MRYVKYQLKWIRKRPQNCENWFPIYKVDSTVVDQWDSHVLDPSIHVIETYLNNTSDDSFAPMEVNKSAHNPHKPFVCDVCGGKVIMGKIPYEAHLAGKAHRANLKKLRKVTAEQGLNESTG